MQTLRSIDISQVSRCDLREQPAPMLDWIALDKLRIDERYQRPLGSRNWLAIQKIAANFDWCAFSPILVAPIAGGLYAVIDGQHRAHAAAACGIDIVPAMIVPVPSARQATAFVAINSGIGVTNHQRFKAELAAEDPIAVAIRDACAEAGCKAMVYNPTAKSRKPREVYCISLLRSAIERGQKADLTAALSAIATYDDKGRAPLYSEYVLQPLVGAIAATGVRDTGRLVRVLQAKDIFTVLAVADRAAAASGSSVGLARKNALKIMIERTA